MCQGSDHQPTRDSGTASASPRRRRGRELNDCLPTSTAPLLEGMLRRAEVWQRGSNGRWESRRIMEVRFYPITSATLVKTSPSFVEVFCGIMTKLQKKGFVWKQRGVCLYERGPIVLGWLCAIVCVCACVYFSVCVSLRNCFCNCASDTVVVLHQCVCLLHFLCAQMGQKRVSSHV